MPGGKKRTEQDSEFEHDKARKLPCLSPLHAIPGFDRVSLRKLYPKGSVLIAEGQTSRGVFVLCAGHAKVSVTSAEGKTLIVRIARSGDLIGINATLMGSVYEATVETLGPCRVDFITRSDFLQLFDRQKSHGLGLAMAVSKEFAEFMDHVRVLLLSASATEKLARLLLRFGDEFGERTSGGLRVRTLLTHEEMAQMIGVSRETVTRGLSELRRKHIVNLTDNAIFIRSRKGLETVAALDQ